jgi:cbb3-type cytochrome oxidase maturation protein
MSVILILILASLGVALLFLLAFIWAVRSGQFEDTCTPAMRILTDDAPPKPVSDSETKPEAK